MGHHGNEVSFKLLDLLKQLILLDILPTAPIFNDEAVGDEEVIAEVLSGNREAFSILVERYQKQVFALAYRRVGEAGLAEDITQDAFIRAYKSLHLFRKDSSFYWWTSRIVLNISYDRSRSTRFLLQVA